MKPREQYFDILRALACVLVVLTHCVPPAPAGVASSGLYGAVSLVLSVALSWGVVRAIKLLPWGKYIVG